MARFIYCALFSFVVVVLIDLYGQSYLAHKMNNAWNDKLIKIAASNRVADKEILLIDIDDLSLHQLEDHFGKWPWPRSSHAMILESINSFQPKAVIFDILFSEYDHYRPDDDSYFIEVINNSDNLYFSGTELNSNKSVAPILLSDYKSVLKLRGRGDESVKVRFNLPWIIPQEKWRVGSIAFELDADGIGRHYSVRHNYSGWHWLSLPALLAEDFNTALPSANFIQLNWVSQHLIPYPSISFATLLFTLESNNVQAIQALQREIKDKYVFIGSTATGLFDARPTPISSEMPALSILATAFDNLKNQNYYTTVDSNLAQFSIALISSLIIFLVLFIGKLKQAALISGVFFTSFAITLLSLSYVGLSQNQLWPVVWPVFNTGILLVSILLVRGFLEYQKKLALTHLFSRFLDPRVVQQLVDDEKTQLLTQSKECEITVLFSDIRGFTTLSENNTAPEIVSLLNQYFSLQVETVFKYGGTLDKFIGDAIMAFWGAPLEDPQHASNAFKAAIEMTENLQKFKQSLPTEFQDFDVGIGLHSGNAVVGMIGSKQRIDYTAIGDTVNLTSRIEGLTKDRARILVSETTQQQISTNIEWVDMGKHQVKGRQQPVQLYSYQGALL